MAARYEYYSDFGGNLAGKLATRYKISDKLSIRGSISNGFRAPSLQQRYNSSVVLGYSFVGGIPVPTTRGTFPNDHPVVTALGVPSLTAEKTINLSVGLTSAFFKNISITIDAYEVQIKNRIVYSSTFERDPNSALDTILDKYPEFNQIDRVQFFSNAINTRTSGVDLVANGKWNINKSKLGIMLAGNFTKTRLFGKIKGTVKLPADSLFNIEEITKLEKGQPGSKIILSLTWEKGKTKFILTNTRFGKTETTTLYTQTNPTIKKFIPEKFSPKVLTDLNINYSLKPWMTITAGANNLFNVYPDPIKQYENTTQGIYIYSPEASPFGFNGGYYYVSMSFNF
jgi:iron complex outermembrane recepter protein